MVTSCILLSSLRNWNIGTPMKSCWDGATRRLLVAWRSKRWICDRWCWHADIAPLEPSILQSISCSCLFVGLFVFLRAACPSLF
uniref:Uncharacterized protein n=1 Tax=Arundo donax TaxID=35708 RepID=A0A0A9B2M3_ARUDO